MAFGRRTVDPVVAGSSPFALAEKHGDRTTGPVVKTARSAQSAGVHASACVKLHDQSAGVHASACLRVQPEGWTPTVQPEGWTPTTSGCEFSCLHLRTVLKFRLATHDRRRAGGKPAGPLFCTVFGNHEGTKDTKETLCSASLWFNTRPRCVTSRVSEMSPLSGRVMVCRRLYLPWRRKAIAAAPISHKANAPGSGTAAAPPISKAFFQMRKSANVVNPLKSKSP